MRTFDSMKREARRDDSIFSCDPLLPMSHSSQNLSNFANKDPL